MKKTWLSALLMMSMLFSCCIAQADEAHVHKVCGTTGACTHLGTPHTVNNIEWQPWDGSGSLPIKSGDNYFYLTKDVEITTEIVIGGGQNVYLCLNGHDLVQKDDSYVLKVGSADGLLSLADCQSECGTITNKTHTGIAVYGKMDMYGGRIADCNNVVKNSHHAGGIAVLADDAVFNMYGGCIENNATNIGNNVEGGAGGVCLRRGSMNLYGGVITNNFAPNTNSQYNAGGIYVGKNARSLTIYDGVVTGNWVVDKENADNVHLASVKTITWGNGSAPTETEQIGVTCADVESEENLPHVFLKNGNNDGVTKAQARYFFSDDGYGVGVDEQQPKNGVLKKKPIEYTITYHLNDGAIPNGKENPTKYTEDDDNFTLLNPEREGYTFTGWTGSNGQSANKNVTVDTSGKTNLEYTANWKVNQYTITFDTDGGSEIAPITQDYGSDVTAPAAPKKEGYFFVGWDSEIPDTMPAKNLTIKARWTVKKVVITFDTDGGSAIEPINQDFGTPIVKPENPTKSGYTFTGWDKEIPATMPAEDMTITASWKVNQYTIVFDTDGGSEIAPITQNYGSAVTAPAAPTKLGYTFAGWEPALPETMPLNGLGVKAKWKVNQYTIKFDTDGGSEVAPITQDYGSVVTAPADPTKNGYFFMGWDSEIPDTMPAKDLTIKALWTVKKVVITFNTDGGSAIKPINQDFGTPIVKPENPTKEGYTFAGWDKEIPETMPAEDMTITAKWTVNQYTITFDTDGGSEIAPITQNYGSAVTAPAAPIKNGYTFAGWDMEIPETMPAGNLTIKAQWTLIPLPDLPQTGDSSRLVLWLALLTMAGAGALILRRKAHN